MQKLSHAYHFTETRIFCVVEEYLPLGMFHTAILMLGFGHYETMAIFFFFFFPKKFNFHSRNSKDTTKISKPSQLYRGREIFKEKKIAVLLNWGSNLASVWATILVSRLIQQKLQKLNSAAKAIASTHRTAILHLLAEKSWSS